MEPTHEHAEAAMLDLLARRDPGKTICPSDAARVLGGDEGFRPLMPLVRDAARALVAARRIEATQSGQTSTSMRHAMPSGSGRCLVIGDLVPLRAMVERTTWTLDGRRATVDELLMRLALGLPDEVVLDVGLAGHRAPEAGSASPRRPAPRECGRSSTARVPQPLLRLVSRQ